MQIKSQIKKIIKKFYYSKGLKTNRQIVVFESDDWGAERSFSKKALDELMSKHANFEPDNYQAFDCTETDEDVKKLKKAVLKHKDKNGNPACFTLNFATKNLDYDAMKDDGYKSVKLLGLDEYYKLSSSSKKVLAEVADGEYKGCFLPQLHAREHINTEELIADISTGDQLQKDALNLKIVGVKNSLYCGMDCLNVPSEKSNVIIDDATREFKRIFGQFSESFIAPCYVWKNSDEKTLEENGVKFLQGKLFQNVPAKNGKYKKKLHRFGEKSKVSNIRYFYRNCFFEPSKDLMNGVSEDAILSDIISQIKFAFKCKKPAVICSHRVNYIGGISTENREKCLMLLDRLLSMIKAEFQDVEFMSTPEMCKEILKENAKGSKV